jgi:hypothetical protein
LNTVALLAIGAGLALTLVQLARRPVPTRPKLVLSAGGTFAPIAKIFDFAERGHGDHHPGRGTGTPGTRRSVQARRRPGSLRLAPMASSSSTDSREGLRDLIKQVTPIAGGQVR